MNRITEIKLTSNEVEAILKEKMGCGEDFEMKVEFVDYANINLGSSIYSGTNVSDNGLTTTLVSISMVRDLTDNLITNRHDG